MGVREILNGRKTARLDFPRDFAVTGGNEAGVDIVLIPPFLLYYVNRVVLMLTCYFLSKIYIRKEEDVFIKTRLILASRSQKG